MYEIARVGADDLPKIEPASIPDRLREWDRSIQEMIPTVKAHAAQLDVSLDQNGYNVLEDLLMDQPQAALDAIDRCIGAADVARHRALLRLVIPIYWLVDVPALAVRWPWLIMNRAGLPAEIESNVVSYVLRVLLFIAQALITLYLIGNKVSPDLVRALIPK